jgi:bisphosphoglycerate-dependent phosphoglycerate mutase
MKNDESNRWEQQMREAVARVEEELRRVVTYINDQVVPEVRRNGSVALRAASDQLQKLAQRMEDHRAAARAQHPPAPSTPEPPAPEKDKP